jgi:hypothetical protein
MILQWIGGARNTPLEHLTRDYLNVDHCGSHEQTGLRVHTHNIVLVCWNEIQFKERYKDAKIFLCLRMFYKYQCYKKYSNWTSYLLQVLFITEEYYTKPENIITIYN